MAKNPLFAAFLNIANSVNYPSQCQLDDRREPDQDQRSAQAVTGNPSQVLGAIQQTATSGS